MDNDWIKDYRKSVEWWWYKDVPTCHLFFHLLRRVNWKQWKFKMRDVFPWEIITGRKQLSFETWLTEQQIRTSLEKLKSTNDITIESTNSFSHIKVQNWSKYQQDNTQQITNQQPTDNQQITTIEEGNKGNKERKKEIDTTTADFYEQELQRVTDPSLLISLREWWQYKKGKYKQDWWQKTITIALKYPPKSVCDRIDEAIASWWEGMNLSTIPKDKEQQKSYTFINKF